VQGNIQPCLPALYLFLHALCSYMHFADLYQVTQSLELYGGIMSTTLIALASILAIFALILIPLMMVKSDKQKIHHQQRDYGDAGKKPSKKKKKR
jgi:hypothetical protein